MKQLARSMRHEVKEGSWKPIKLARNRLSVSHMFFVDDLVLFAEAWKEQRMIIKRILDDFCQFGAPGVSLLQKDYEGDISISD
ncbi:Retrovirus-related Pol polyprotein LINE-1 [Gossypium australe]|uniref:Retrovirus-related Pol polyprotein LINE-1 n=1 Tax=Gossypium australe TaxID=47621 RepID=A0A5B6WX62_9ROSI|nr:Retrovirus-related Pol polyprotein LINE-1 [Gossypium australe]